MSEDLIFWHNLCMPIFEPGILRRGTNLGLFWTREVFCAHLSETYCISSTDLPNALAVAPKSEYT